MGTHVHPWWIYVNVWQNQYSIVKLKKNLIKYFLKRKKKTKKNIKSKSKNKNKTYKGIPIRFAVDVQSLSRVQLYNPMNKSTPGSSVLYYLLEFTQIPVH